MRERVVLMKRSFRRRQRGGEVSPREINLGERMPGLEGFGRGLGCPAELGEGGIRFAEGIIGRGVFDQGL